MTSPVSSIIDLPYEVMENIFSFLDSESRISAGAVCRYWRDVFRGVYKPYLPFNYQTKDRWQLVQLITNQQFGQLYGGPNVISTGFLVDAAANRVLIKNADQELLIYTREGELIKETDLKVQIGAISADGSLIAINYEDAFSFLNRDGQVVYSKRWQPLERIVNRIVISGDGSTILTEHLSKLNVWNRDGTYRCNFSPISDLQAIRTSFDGSVLCIVASHTYAFVNEGVMNICRAGYMYRSAYLSENGNTLVLEVELRWENGDSVYSLQILSKEEQRLLSTPMTLNRHRVALAADGNVIATSCGQEIDIWQRHGSEVSLFYTIEDHPVTNLALSSDSTILITCQNKQIYIWCKHRSRYTMIGAMREKILHEPEEIKIEDDGTVVISCPRAYASIFSFR